MESLAEQIPEPIRVVLAQTVIPIVLIVVIAPLWVASALRIIVVIMIIVLVTMLRPFVAPITRIMRHTLVIVIVMIRRKPTPPLDAPDA